MPDALALPDPALAARFAAIFADLRSTDLIGNINCSVCTEDFGGLTVPVTRSDPPNGYLCSPHAAYIDYGAEETRHFTGSPALRFGLLGLLKAASPLVRAARLDRQVQVNNWLFSTCPVPPISPTTTANIRDRLVASDPDRAIVIRSLNDAVDRKSMAHLLSAGFILLPARQIYIADHRSPGDTTKDMRKDRRLLTKSIYSVVEGDSFAGEDVDRAAELYRMLYLDRYSWQNPQYNTEFLSRAHDAGVLHLFGLREPEGRLDGVGGIFRIGRSMTMPLLGLDTRIPQSVGLYRMLCALAQDRAIANGFLYNRSAGAAGFKRNRGAKPATEYTAVYVDHLGRGPRGATHALAAILRRVGVPLLQRFAL